MENVPVHTIMVMMIMRVMVDGLWRWMPWVISGIRLDLATTRRDRHSNTDTTFFTFERTYLADWLFERPKFDSLGQLGPGSYWSRMHREEKRRVVISVAQGYRHLVAWDRFHRHHLCVRASPRTNFRLRFRRSSLVTPTKASSLD